MKCPHSAGLYMLSCKARGEVYIPSFFELEEYCKDKKHKICPYFHGGENPRREASAAAKASKGELRW